MNPDSKITRLSTTSQYCEEKHSQLHHETIIYSNKTHVLVDLLKTHSFYPRCFYLHSFTLDESVECVSKTSKNPVIL